MQILSQINNFLRNTSSQTKAKQSTLRRQYKVKAQFWVGSSQLVFRSQMLQWNLPVQPGVIFAEKSVRCQLQLLKIALCAAENDGTNQFSILLFTVHKNLCCFNDLSIL